MEETITISVDKYEKLLQDSLLVDCIGAYKIERWDKWKDTLQTYFLNIGDIRRDINIELQKVA